MGHNIPVPLPRDRYARLCFAPEAAIVNVLDDIIVSFGPSLDRTGARTPGIGQSATCGEREIFVEHLNLAYDETQTAMGISAQGEFVEVFSGPSGSWTILITNPSGLTCVVTDGDYWKHVDRPHGAIRTPLYGRLKHLCRPVRLVAGIIDPFGLH